ncbi:hypothetical protein PspLS_10162 [Pyricularia sp. CBS 133598]|nr:hypothetical protein PspLS_10162 [Pyricularia sp. CBS 133598]
MDPVVIVTGVAQAGIKLAEIIKHTPSTGSQAP